MKSTIKETKYPKTDAKGSSCLVVLNDNTDGFFNYKGAFPFAVGEEVEYTATKTEKKTKPGEFYNVLKIEKTGTSSQPSPNTPAGQAPKAPHTANIAQMKFDARMKVVELAIGGLFGGKFKDVEEEKGAKTFVASWVSFTDGLIDEIFTSR